MRTTNEFKVLESWPYLLKELGMDLRKLLDVVNLPGAELPDALTLDEFSRLWQRMELEIGAEQLPLALVSRYDTEHFDPAVLAAHCSPNLKTAIERLSLFKPLVGPMRLDSKDTRRWTEIRFDFRELLSHIPVSYLLTELLFLVAFARHGLAQKVIPLAVTLPLAQRVRAAEQFLECKIEAGNEVMIRFDAATMSRPFRSRDDELWAFYSAKLQNALNLSDRNMGDTTASVRKVLMECLPGGRTNIEDVCQSLAMSKRTLQRKLSEVGSSFQDELASVRSEMAVHYLTNSRFSNAEIAYLLGYRDPNSFYRAFQSWHGVTPALCRASSASSAAYTVVTDRTA